LLLEVVGVLLLWFGFLAMRAVIRRARRRAAVLRAAPVTTIARAVGNGPVRIAGTIVAGDEGLVAAPFSGLSAVWVRVQVARAEGKRVSFPLVDKTASRPFYVDDGSGQLARVLPDGACVECPSNTQEGSTWREPIIGSLDAILDEESARRIGPIPLDVLRYSETALVPGDRVLVVGPSRREPGPSVETVYRSLSTAKLDLCAKPEEEIVITKQTFEELASSSKTHLALMLLILGLTMIAPGLASLLIGACSR
jgi:hypothetical protein